MVCGILSLIDVSLTPDEIEACHRLPHSKFINDQSKPKRTIVKFVNRKVAKRSHGK